MRFASLRTVVLLMSGCVSALGVAHANDYNVYFNDPVAGEVGTGTFSFSGNLGDGAYLLTSLPNYNIDFNVEGDTFTNADIDPVNLANVQVVLYDNGNNFYFDTNCFETAGCYSTDGGSIDFVDPNNSEFALSTEPNYFGPAPLDLYIASGPNGDSTFGTYSATPEPETLWLLGTGLAGLMIRRFRRA